MRETANGTHRFEAGFALRKQRATAPNINNRNGVFAFNSLEDLQASRPASFTRTLSDPAGTAGREYAAIYLGDTWRNSSRSFGVTYGLRMDANGYDARPAPTPAVDAIANSAGASAQIPSEFLITPRLGFSYDAPSWSVDGGVGGFAGVANLQALAAAWRETGAAGSTLLCVGPAAPTPEWLRYAIDPSAIPSTCANGTSIFAGDANAVGVFDRAFRSPRTWRASLGGDRSLGPRWGVRVDGLLVHGTHLASAVDLNLAPAVGFTLADEGNRPVYSAPDAIDPATGGIASAASRRDPSLSNALDVASLGESWTTQLTAALNGTLGATLVSFGYAFTLSRVRQSGIPAPGAAGGSTAGDPTHLEWMDSPFAPQHAFQLIASRGLGSRLRISAVARLSSGLSFTPLVGGDINGDTFANDRAFIFDPSTVDDSALARGMARLERAAPGAVRDCLRRQTGRVAAPGSCRTGWSPSLDVSAQLYALGDVNSRRLIVTLTASNITAGVDYLVHGPDRLRGWGQFANPDATLLEVRGFDPERRSFTYAVNPNFGRPLESGLLFQPFQIALQARLTIGSDPRYQPLAQAIEAGRSTSSANARAMLAEFVHNVPAVVLRLAATDTAALHLTLAQKASLHAAADSLEPEIQAALDSLVASWVERGPMTAVRTARLQTRSMRAQSVMRLAIERTRLILSADQWAILPAWVVRPPPNATLRRPTFNVSVPDAEP